MTPVELKEVELDSRIYQPVYRMEDGRVARVVSVVSGPDVEDYERVGVVTEDSPGWPLVNHFALRYTIEATAAELTYLGPAADVPGIREH